MGNIIKDFFSNMNEIIVEAEKIAIKLNSVDERLCEFEGNTIYNDDDGTPYYYAREEITEIDLRRSSNTDLVFNCNHDSYEGYTSYFDLVLPIDIMFNEKALDNYIKEKKGILDKEDEALRLKREKRDRENKEKIESKKYKKYLELKKEFEGVIVEEKEEYPF